MSTPQPTVRTYKELRDELMNRKSASAKAAGHTASVPAVPEKDVNEKGTQSVPTDKDATNTKLNLPANSTNADATKDLAPPTLAKTVDGPEKAAAAKNRFAALAADVRGLTKAALTPKKPNVLGTAAPPNPHDNTGGTQAPPPGSSGPKGDTSATAPNTVKAAEKGDAGAMDPTQKKAPSPSGDSIGAIPASGENTDTTKKAEDAKAKLASDAVTAEEIARDPLFFAKMAGTMLKYEDGRRAMQVCLEREHGARCAEDIIKAATFMEELAVKAEQEEAAGFQAAEEMWKNASAEERQEMIKFAMVMNKAKETLPDDLCKEAFDAGAGAAAAMSDAGQMGAEPPPGADMTGQGPVQDQDIAEVLAEMVQTGQITPEIAEQILTALQGGDPAAAGGAPGADPAAAAGGGAPPMDPAAGGGGVPPMDPAAAGGGAPPVDPAALAAMAGGAGGPPGGAPAPAPGGPPPEGEPKGAKKSEGGDKKEPKEDKGEKKEASVDLTDPDAIVKLAAATVAALSAS